MKPRNNPLIYSVLFVIFSIWFIKGEINGRNLEGQDNYIIFYYGQDVEYKRDCEIGNSANVDHFIIEGQKIIFPEVSGMLTFDFDTEQNPLNSSISHALVEHISFVYNNKEGSQSIPQSILKVYDMFRAIRI